MIHAGLLAWAAGRHSPSPDEVGHLAAGLSHWSFGRFELYRVNPPLVRMAATLPVVFADPVIPWSHFASSPGARPEFELGAQLIAANGQRWLWFFLLARWACIPFSLLGAWVCYRWAGELYGPPAGFLAAVLWCFCPNVLGHAQMITPDVAAASLGVAAAYLFWRWLRRPGWPRAAAAGVVLGLAELAKTTWVILFVLWPLLWWLYRRPERRASSWHEWQREGGQLGGILLLGLLAINLGYGFSGSFQGLGDFRFVSATLGGPADSEQPAGAGRNRFADTWLAAVPVPLPADYLRGIDVQKADFEGLRPSYLCGEWRYAGWWYFYLYGLVVKVPLGTWALLLLAAFVGLCRRGYAAAGRDEGMVLAPLLVLLFFISSQIGMTHHLRYVLPVFPFAFIWASKLARCVALREWAVAAVAAPALLGSMVSSLAVYPHSLSYFNELAGGPEGGAAHLLDSNLDWGQDLLYLKRWLDEHPEARPLGLAYWGGFDPRNAGIEVTPPTRAPRPGWFAVSVNNLYGLDGEYAYFRHFRPVARAGYSIYIYHVGRDEADRVHRELGLDENPRP